MDLKQLRHLVAIIDHESFSRAADAVAISQPALTRSIKLLEQRLGVALLERTTRSVSPTPAGERLYKRAKLILNETDAAISEVREDLGRSKPLRIGIAPMFATTIVPSAIRAFRTIAPDIEVAVQSGLFEVLTAQVAQGDLDLVVSNLPYGRLEDDLTSETLLDVDVVYLASTDHPLAGHQKNTLSDLFGYPWAVVDETHANDLYGYIFASEGDAPSPIRVRTNSLNLLKSLIETPPWISLLPRHMVQSELDCGQICELHVTGEPVRRNAGIVYRRSRSEDPDLKRFSETVRAACADYH